MAASKTQGSYVGSLLDGDNGALRGPCVFRRSAPASCFLLIGLAGVLVSLFGFMKLKPTEGKTAA